MGTASTHDPCRSTTRRASIVATPARKARRRAGLPFGTLAALGILGILAASLGAPGAGAQVGPAAIYELRLHPGIRLDPLHASIVGDVVRSCTTPVGVLQRVAVAVHASSLDPDVLLVQPPDAQFELQTCALQPHAIASFGVTAQRVPAAPDANVTPGARIVRIVATPRPDGPAYPAGAPVAATSAFAWPAPDGSNVTRTAGLPADHVVASLPPAAAASAATLGLLAVLAAAAIPGRRK